jgi:hypothetical protein
MSKALTTNLSTYQHDKLDYTKKQMRLLVLLPSADKYAPLEARLETLALPPASHHYAALSYVWGDPAKKFTT